MIERPILMSAPMVLACLRDENPKTQTRRIIKPQPARVYSPGDAPTVAEEVYAYATLDEGWMIIRAGRQPRENALVSRCPYGVAGDGLWVRENCRATSDHEYRSRVTYAAGGAHWPIENTADAADRWGRLYRYDHKRRDPGPLVPGIHMPRWASRISLSVTDVRVERLNEISAADAKAEGLTLIGIEWGVPGLAETWRAECHDPRRAYRILWEHINGPGSWAANPWVWAVTFERIA